MFLVDADAKGVTVTRTHMVDSRNAAIVSLDGVEVLPMTLWAALARPIRIGKCAGFGTRLHCR